MKPQNIQREEDEPAGERRGEKQFVSPEKHQRGGLTSASLSVLSFVQLQFIILNLSL